MVFEGTVGEMAGGWSVVNNISIRYILFPRKWTGHQQCTGGIAFVESAHNTKAPHTPSTNKHLQIHLTKKQHPKVSNQLIDSSPSPPSNNL